MSDDAKKSKIGTIGWHDLTVPNAPEVRDFYSQVIGWTTQEVDMGDYADYTVHDQNGECVAGVCHARGGNSNLPPQWLLYLIVEDVDKSAAKATDLGGSILDGPRDMGGARMCVIKDPAGAVCALYQEG